MIPLKLHIKNFLSYGSPTQTIDFGPYHLICLSGKNGHGKSALLDALTWAVWGQARKGLGSTKADEGLIRLGQTHMAASLDFISNGQTYRVRREFSYDRSGKGVAQLDFGIIDQETGKFRELTDKTIRTTQNNIEQTIGFSHESFINSVFLRQGNSNEFSKKSPKERKEVLANILGLSKYEILRKHALEKIREGSFTTAYLKKSCELLLADIQDHDAYKKQLAELTQTHQALLQQEKQFEKELQQVTLQKKVIVQRQQELQKISLKYEQVKKAITDEEKKLRTTYQAWRNTQKQQRSLARTPYTEARKKVIEQELSQIQHIINKKLLLTECMMGLSSQLQELHINIQAQRAEQLNKQSGYCHQISTKISLLHAEQTMIKKTLLELVAEETQITTEKEALHKSASIIDTHQAELTKQEQLFERRKAFYHAWVARGNKIAQELKKTVVQQKQLAQTDVLQCPLCEQDLSAMRQKFLQHQFLGQENFLNHQIKRLSKVIPQLKQLLTSQYPFIETLKHEIAQASHAGARAQEITKTLKQTTQAIANKKQLLETIDQEIILLQASLDAAHKQKLALEIPLQLLLSTHVEYCLQEDRLKQYKQELSTLFYDQDHYEKLKKELLFITEICLQQQDQVQQRLLQEQRKKEIQVSCKIIRFERKELRTLQDTLASFKTLAEKHNICETEEQKLVQEKQAIAQQKEEVAHQRGALEQICNRIAQQEIVLKKEQAKLLYLENDLNDFQIVAQALSKDGIQGLLIENVIPEIESEANQLLAKLTHNNTQLTLESVRDLKSGGTKETLDIKIADSTGIRPYELFSGGEAFRIDFALRLAVSKLLARRTGTSLQTLIIDEGFGSQDEEGLNHIMESLYAIQNDFAKIIIVSHLPTMKDQFPVHFHVAKGPRGSSVHVIEQG